MNSIINFSEASSIAIHGTILIAKSSGFINVIKISETLGSSKHHVAKVMQRLTKKGYIDSLRGPNGGFILKKPAEEINFLEIFEAIEGKIKITSCPFGRENICTFEKCILNNVTNKMTSDFVKYLQSQTIAMYLS
jgi:Rrf2 family protein